MAGAETVGLPGTTTETDTGQHKHHLTRVSIKKLKNDNFVLINNFGLHIYFFRHLLLFSFYF